LASIKPHLLAGASTIALIGGVTWLRRPRGTPPHQPIRVARVVPPGTRHRDSAQNIRDILAYFIVPIWIGAGIADWACHRASDIEHTAGPAESKTHLLMLAEMGVPSLAGLFLEINAPVFALMIAAFLAHETTALSDVQYAVARREVTPIEQHVHSFLELMPLTSLCLLAVLHWDQFAALFGLGDAPAEWRLRLKDQPLPKAYVAAVLGAIVLFNLAPYVEELWRGLRATPRNEAATDIRSKSFATDTFGKNRAASAAISAGS